MADSTESIKRTLNSTTNQLGNANSKLASGKRINTASDDAAGLAIAESLAAEVRISGQARRNIGDGQSAIAIADGALGQLSDIGTRLAELSAQAANGTLSDTQRSALQTEFSELSQEASRIVSTTSFNGQQLLGDSGTAIQAGTDASANSQLQVKGVQGEALVASISSLNISSQGAAASAIDGINSFISNVASQRGSLGATSSRISTAETNLSVREEAQTAARSRIEDFDVASGAAEQTSLKIRQQAGTAILAQANQSRETVLRLLS